MITTVITLGSTTFGCATTKLTSSTTTTALESPTPDSSTSTAVSSPCPKTTSLTTSESPPPAPGSAVHQTLQFLLFLSHRHTHLQHNTFDGAATQLSCCVVLCPTPPSADWFVRPYFPPEQPQKFTNVHQVFGASDVTKLLNELHPPQREDAVTSLAYEADMRLRDPVYGCVRVISLLQWNTHLPLHLLLPTTNHLKENSTAKNKTQS